MPKILKEQKDAGNVEWLKKVETFKKNDKRYSYAPIFGMLINQRTLMHLICPWTGLGLSFFGINIYVDHTD